MGMRSKRGTRGFNYICNVLFLRKKVSEANTARGKDLAKLGPEMFSWILLLKSKVFSLFSVCLKYLVILKMGVVGTV